MPDFDLPPRGERAHAGADKPVIMGKVGAPYGIKGWFKVYSYTRPPAQILDYAHWLLGRRQDGVQWRRARLAGARRQGKKLLAKLADTDDRDASARLTGRWIAVAQSQLAPLPAGEYYWGDLIGLAVIDQHGARLGVVSHLFETGANDVLAVADVASAAERLLPWSPQVIREVDLAGGEIRVHWEAGE